MMLPSNSRHVDVSFIPASILSLCTPCSEQEVHATEIIRQHFCQGLLVQLLDFILGCKFHIHDEWLNQLTENFRVIVNDRVRFSACRVIDNVCFLPDILESSALQKMCNNRHGT